MTWEVEIFLDFHLKLMLSVSIIRFWAKRYPWHMSLLLFDVFYISILWAALSKFRQILLNPQLFWCFFISVSHFSWTDIFKEKKKLLMKKENKHNFMMLKYFSGIQEYSCEMKYIWFCFITWNVFNLIVNSILMCFSWYHQMFFIKKEILLK